MDTTDLQALGLSLILFGGFSNVSPDPVFVPNATGALVMLGGLFVVLVSLLPDIGDSAGD
ncbi:hypothetical protein ACOZ4N_19875 [Halorientalis pallida]|uniref:hypothetical protein n=1 Tax=Halorientalis pallida TaxID=2479928 RepID=UPI003C6F27A3